MTEKSKPVLVTVLAHNEEARIALCLDSLPLDDPDVQIWVVVNGSSDYTAEIVRGWLTMPKAANRGAGTGSSSTMRRMRKHMCSSMAMRSLWQAR